MATSVKGFFKERQAAAILKHGVLGRYLPVFATKTGSVAGTVVYLDGYAGPGLYSDGSDGSPALALATAHAISASRGKATLHGHLVEQDPKAVASLRALLQKVESAWEVHQGRAEDHIPGILDSLEPGSPLFAFIDPFGLPIPFEMIVRMLKHSRAAATELLLNFSTSGILRIGGQLTSSPSSSAQIKGRETMLNRMDVVLGGDWWRQIWCEGAPDRVDRIRLEYRKRLRVAAGGRWSVFDIAVSDKWQGPSAYNLLLFTQHPDGVWAFHESLSLAREEYRTYCHEAQGILDFEPLQLREAGWVDDIAQNVKRLLVEEKQFQPVHRIQSVYGEAFGEARETHLRKALKRLYDAGITSTDQKGKLAEKVVKAV